MESIKKRESWNKGKLVGQKPPLKPKDIWATRGNYAWLFTAFQSSVTAGSLIPNAESFSEMPLT